MRWWRGEGGGRGVNTRDDGGGAVVQEEQRRLRSAVKRGREEEEEEWGLGSWLWELQRTEQDMSKPG